MTGQWKATTIGLSESHEKKLKEIKDHLEFDQEADTYKFCFGYALSNDVEQRVANETRRNTKWNMGSLDSDGDLLALMDALYPEADDLQAILMERAESGIDAVHSEVTGKFLYSINELLKQNK